jgi:probable F420-dependent oxidoreductase
MIGAEVPVAVRIGIGLSRYPFSSGSGFRTWLDRCEDGRIDSIWQSDQVLARAPSPEPLSLLSVIAGATQRLKIGTNAVVLGFRDPVTFARQCATLDFLSDGRFLPVVGVGSANLPAWRATGRSPEGRGPRANEALEIITRLWNEESVTFSGEHFRIENASISPQPVQRPLPLWIGGSSAAAIRRTVRYGSGWLAGLQTVEDAIETAAAIRRHASESARGIPEDHYGATLLFRIESGERKSANANDAPPGLAKLLVAGDAERLLGRIQQYVSGGITKFVAVPAVGSSADFLEQTRLLDLEIVPEAIRMAPRPVDAAEPHGSQELS